MEKYIGNSLGLHVFLIVFFCREVILAQPFLVRKDGNFVLELKD